jgi:hypothetical protein
MNSPTFSGCISASTLKAFGDTSGHFEMPPFAWSEHSVVTPDAPFARLDNRFYREADSALAQQVGGDHYKSCAIQPVEFVEANRLGFLEGCVIKRLARHDKPTGKGRQDIEKAIHELKLLLELRYPAAGEING